LAKQADLQSKIRDQVRRYLGRDISLNDFQDWFIPAAWSLEETENALAADLANEIELRLAEFTNGHWTEDELRSQLAAAIGLKKKQVALN